MRREVFETQKTAFKALSPAFESQKLIGDGAIPINTITSAGDVGVPVMNLEIKQNKSSQTKNLNNFIASVDIPPMASQAPYETVEQTIVPTPQEGPEGPPGPPGSQGDPGLPGLPGLPGQNYVNQIGSISPPAKEYVASMREFVRTGATYSAPHVAIELSAKKHPTEKEYGFFNVANSVTQLREEIEAIRQMRSVPQRPTFVATVQPVAEEEKKERFSPIAYEDFATEVRQYAGDIPESIIRSRYEETIVSRTIEKVQAQKQREPEPTRVNAPIAESDSVINDVTPPKISTREDLIKIQDRVADVPQILVEDLSKIVDSDAFKVKILSMLSGYASKDDVKNEIISAIRKYDQGINEEIQGGNNALSKF